MLKSSLWLFAAGVLLFWNVQTAEEPNPKNEKARRTETEIISVDQTQDMHVLFGRSFQLLIPAMGAASGITYCVLFTEKNNQNKQ